MPKRFPKPIIYTLAVILLLLLSTQTVLGKRILLDNTLIKAIKNFLSSPETIISACDYKDGYIILVKPIATGVGEGRYEAGDIVEIRNGQELCARFGNSNFLGNEERTTLLPLYYPKKLTEEEKKELLAPEYSISNDKFPMTNQIQNPNDQTTHPNPSAGGDKPAKLLRRRSTGIDYAQILSDREIIKARSQEQIDRIPEVDLSNIIDKNPTLSGPTALGETASQKNKLTDLKSVLNNTQAVGPLNTKTVLQNLKISKLFENLKFKIENYGHDSVVHLPPIVAIYEKTKNTLTSIARLVVSPVIAQSSPTEVTKTVDTGGYADYLSLNAWEAGQQADLTSTNEIRIADCEAKTATSTADAAAVTIDGWTTSATQYIKIWTNPAKDHRHNGKWDTNKYRLEPTAEAVALDIRESYVRTDGMQIKATTDNQGPGYSQYALRVLGSGVTNVRISNNIITNGNLLATDGRIGIYVDPNTSAPHYIWNNIVYDFSSNDSGIAADTDYGTAPSYIYNNTIYNCSQGIFTAYGDSLAKNNLVASTTDPYNGFFFDGTDYNATDINDIPDNGGSNNRVNQTFNFADAANKDFRLAYTDTGARDWGTNLSGDTNLSFTDDIDGQARPYGLGASSTKWDIGADEFRPTEIYRSVGPGNTSPLAAGYTAGATISISGSNATFSTPLPDNIGVGDVIIYTSTQGTSNTATNSIAFIHGRTDSTHYIVKDVAGKMASTTMVATTKWAIYRAYTSLCNALDYGYNCTGGTENSGIPLSLRNFDTWSGGKNLASSTERWNVACYGDAADTNPVYLDTSTTTADNYIRIYTPYLPSEVGISQRHSGMWDETKYRMEGTDPGGGLIWVIDNYVRIEGLQVWVKGTGDYNEGISVSADAAVPLTSVYVSDSIIKSTNTGSYNTGLGFTAWSVELHDMRAWNNIVYGFNTASSSCVNAYAWLSGSEIGVYLYNNTVYDCKLGINNAWLDVLAKNNIVQNSQDGYDEAEPFAAGSDYNISDIPGETTGGAHDKSGTKVRFADAANKDFHLALGSVARDAGANLTNDADLSFSTDIDGQNRPETGAWDIGADEIVKSTMVNTPITNKFRDSSLVLDMSFNGADMNWASTTAEALDRSGSNNNGDSVNANPTIGINGQALNFNGSSYVTTGKTALSLLSSTTGTFSVWVNQNNLTGTQEFISSVRSSINLLSTYFCSYYTSDWNNLNTGITPVVKNWYHLVFVWDTTGHYCYVNGSLKNSDSITSPISYHATGFLSVGAFSAPSYGNYAKALLDEVRIYNRALSAAEISAQYKAGAARLKVNTPPPAPAGLSSGLVGNWTFNGQDMNWGSTTAEALDRSSYGNNGNVVSAIGDIGKVGQALKFDGVDDYVDMGDPANLDWGSGDGSVSLWFKTSFTATSQRLFSKKQGSSAAVGYSMQLLAPGDICFNVADGVNYDQAGSGVGPNTADGKWHHAVGTWDYGIAAKMYVDGQLEHTDSTINVSGSLDTVDHFEIGRCSDACGGPLFNGLIDEVRVYNRALTVSEIQQLYELGATRKAQIKGN